MIRQIDHLVIISDDLSTAISNAETAGFTVVPGGTHADGNTHNALIGFHDGTYIELIAPTEQGRHADHRWFARLRNGGGLVDFCLLGDNLATETAAMRERGIDYPEPFAMGRHRPDGVRIDWQLSTPPGRVGEHGWPFLIEDTTPRDLRVPDSEPDTTHANGAIGVAGVTVIVSDLTASTRDYAAILGTEGEPLVSPLLGENLGRKFVIGSQWIALVQPTEGTSLTNLQQHGQGPDTITLRTTTGPITPGEGLALDPELLSGARVLIG